MVGKVIIRLVALLAVLCAALGIAYLLRDDLVRFLAPRVLADQQLRLTHFNGLQFNTRRLFVDDIELELASGQRLAMRELAVSYHFDSPLRAPQIESIALASAQLSPAADAANTEDAQDDTDSLLLSDLLQLLREFPLAQVAVAELRIPQSSRPLALQLQGNSGELTIAVDNGDLRLDAQFSQLDASAPAVLDVKLAQHEITLGDFELQLQPDASSYNLQGAGQLAIDDLKTLLDALQQAPLPFKSAMLEWDIAGSIANDLRGTFESAVNAPADGSAPRFVIGMQAGSSLVLPADAVEGLGELSIAFTDRAELSVVTGLQTVVAGTLPLQLRGDWQQQALSVDARIALEQCQLAATAACGISFNGRAGLGMYSIAGVINAALIGNNDPGDPLARYTINTDMLELGGLPEWIPSFDIAAELTREQQTLSFSTPLLLRDMAADPGITLNGSYDLDSGFATVKAGLASMEFAEGRALSNWIDGWPYAVDLLTGSVSAELDLQWQPGEASDEGNGEGKLTGSVSALLQDLAGSYEDVFFRGLNTELSGTVDSSAPMPLDTPPLALTLTSVDVGLPLENIALDFRLDREGQRLLIDSLSAQVLGGSVGANAIDYGFSRESNALALRFDGLRLERMLELAEYDGVVANGAVSGEVPITITAEGVSVTAGTLHADAPGGNIRYVAAATGPTGNPGLDLVNQALGNYQFDTLVSDINYTPAGELLFAMKMEGHNPDMNNGQRINLNLNLSDNVPALLESLQAARAIEDFLQEQYSKPQP